MERLLNNENSRSGLIMMVDVKIALFLLIFFSFDAQHC